MSKNVILPKKEIVAMFRKLDKINGAALIVVDDGFCLVSTAASAKSKKIIAENLETFAKQTLATIAPKDDYVDISDSNFYDLVVVAKQVKARFEFDEIAEKLFLADELINEKSRENYIDKDSESEYLPGESEG